MLTKLEKEFPNMSNCTLFGWVEVLRKETFSSNVHRSLQAYRVYRSLLWELNRRKGNGS